MTTPTVRILALIGLALASPVAAQGRYGAPAIPPGQLPRPGLCRVWYDHLPPDRQPAPTSCRTAEAIASRDRSARVIYGDTAGVRPRIYDRDGDRDRGGYRDNDRGGIRRAGPAFNIGYRDGYDQGLDDARDRDRFNATGHGRYRSATHGYEREYGPKEWYKDVYRGGFTAGYEAGYRDGNPRGRDRGWRR